METWGRRIGPADNGKEGRKVAGRKVLFTQFRWSKLAFTAVAGTCDGDVDICGTWEVVTQRRGEVGKPGIVRNPDPRRTNDRQVLSAGER